MVVYIATHGSIIASSLSLLQDTPPYSAHVPFFHISYYSRIILVRVSSSYFTFAVPMREVSCVGYTPRAWGPRPL